MPTFGKSESSWRGVELAEARHQTSTASAAPRQSPSHEPDNVFPQEGSVNQPSQVTSESSSSHVYSDPSANDLSMWQAAALLTADCLGTGLLALPQDVKVLGRVVGLGFLIVNLPINLYAGTILSNAAAQVEYTDQDDKAQTRTGSSSVVVDGIAKDGAMHRTVNGGDGLVRVVRNQNRATYSSIKASDADLAVKGKEQQVSSNVQPASSGPSDDDDTVQPSKAGPIDVITSSHPHLVESSTYDFIGMTQEVFHHPRATHFVMAFFYTNIFLVLGDYILVMSHAVAAVFGEGMICLPTAGILASALMFAFSQLRTMANLGRSATILSLGTLLIVVIQCLVAAQNRRSQPVEQEVYASPSEGVTVLRILSAFASIGFAVGSQKLLLNIRHEMKHRYDAPKSLGTALTTYGSVYVAICLLSGPDPPAFLFDNIPPGLNRRIAGLLLWIHVSVSYAINSQAICASIDRVFFHRIALFDLRHHPQRRWLILTLLMAISSYLVANVVPFFKDLVALIGALTSVPLTLLLPALIHRRVIQAPLWCPTSATMWSFGLVLFGLAFLFTGLVGSLGSIELDWSNHGPPFACDQ